MSINCALSDPQHLPSLLLATFSILLSFVIDYGIYKTITHYKNAQVKPPKSLFMIGLLFVILSSITMITFSILLITSILYCHHDSELLVKISNCIVSISYVFQIHLLHLLWLKRLKFVFHSTTYEISSFAYYGYMACLLTIWISTILSIVLIPFIKSTTHNQFALLIGQGFIEGLSYLISAIFLSFLLFTFIYKLHNLYSFNNDGRTDNTHLISAITKNIILASMSIFCTLILSFVIIVNSNVIQTIGNSIPIEIIYTIILIDITTNAICVMLTFVYHKNIYHKICGCVDTKCKLIYVYKYKSNPIQTDHISNQMQTTINLQAIHDDIENDFHMEHNIKNVTTPSVIVKRQMTMASIFSGDCETDHEHSIFQPETNDVVSMINHDEFKVMSPQIIKDCTENIFNDYDECGGEEKIVDIDSFIKGVSTPTAFATPL
eukprot:81261_1